MLRIFLGFWSFGVGYAPNAAPVWRSYATTCTIAKQKLYQCVVAANGNRSEPSLKRSTLNPYMPFMEKIMARRTPQNAQEILLADFQTLVADTEKLLDHTASLAGEQADLLREQIKDSLLRARETLKQTEDSLRQRGEAAVIATEDYVQNNPWQSVGIAAGAGFLIGLLASRR